MALWCFIYGIGVGFVAGLLVACWLEAMDLF
jgi:hypothetical protein